MKDFQIEWKEAYDYPGYEISNTGEIRSYHNFGHPLLTKPKTKKVTIDRSGYGIVTLKCGINKVKTVRFARLILQSFIGLPDDDTFQASHIDGNNGNNHLSNLRWESPQENMHRKHGHGTICKGEDHPGFGKSRSEETKNKIKESLRAMYQRKKNKQSTKELPNETRRSNTVTGNGFKTPLVKRLR